MLIHTLLKSYGFSEKYLEINLRKEKLFAGEIYVLKNSFGVKYLVISRESDGIGLEALLNYSLSSDTVTALIIAGDDNQLYEIDYQSKTARKVKVLDLYEDRSSQIVYAYSDIGDQKLSPLTADVEKIFYDAHNIIRDCDGLHPDEALDEFCKFLYAKIYDEEQNSSKGKYYKTQQNIYNSRYELASTFRDLYANARENDLRIYGLRKPKYKKSRGVFQTNIFLSSLAIDKLIKLFQKYNLSKSNVDIKGRAFQQLYSPATRSGMGQYFTPDPVIDFVIAAIQPTYNDLIIDPFCGSGHFLTKSLAYVSEHIDTNEKRFIDFSYHKLHGIEKSDRMVRISMTDMRLHGDGHSNIRCIDSLLSWDNYEDLKPDSFDIVLSNPPFGSNLSKEGLKSLGDFTLAKGKKTIPLEVIGLERCIQLLRPGGKFGIVLPESIIINKSNEYIRTWLIQHTKLKAIVGLPVTTFSPFGANIKSIILIGNKNSHSSSEDNTFIAEVASVGYDSNGRATNDSDLNDILNEYLKSK